MTRFQNGSITTVVFCGLEEIKMLRYVGSPVRKRIDPVLFFEESIYYLLYKKFILMLNGNQSLIYPSQPISVPESWVMYAAGPRQRRK